MGSLRENFSWIRTPPVGFTTGQEGYPDPPVTESIKTPLLAMEWWVGEEKNQRLYP